MSPEMLRAAAAHCEACYPNEGCGLIATGPSGAEVRPVSNALSGHSFAFDPAEYLAALHDLARRAMALQAVFHSHVDRPAFFSPADERGAELPRQVIISIRQGRAHSAKLFRKAGERWHGEDLALLRV